MLFRALSVIGLLGVLSIPAGALAKCELQRYGELPVTMKNSQALVKGTINGIPALFLIDSGSDDSILRQSSVKKFDIRLQNSSALTFNNDAATSMLVKGLDGVVRMRVGEAKTFTLNGLAHGYVFHQSQFLVGGAFAGDPFDGIIGQNILGHADSEYDLGNGVIRLFFTKDCERTNMAYWAGNAPVTTMRLHRFSRHQPGVVADASLNGNKIQVKLDSGSSRSVLALRAARRIGMSLQDSGVENDGLGTGIAKRQMESWVAHFDSLDLNGEIVKNTRLAILREKNADFDLLLGADFFLSHRIFIAKSQRRVYFTYNGGPVFDLAGSGGKDGHAQADAGNVEAGGKTDAVTLKRRAMALANRQEHDAALAAFDDVIRLAPQDADNYLQRGLIYMAIDKPEPALHDLNQALNLNPGLVKALVARGSYYLWHENDSAAKENFDAAILAAKPDSAVQLDIGNRYLDQNDFKQAVSHFTSWIDANPRSDRLPLALTARCEARAFANQDLKLALDDCQVALRKAHGDSAMYRNIALVYLRLRNYSKAVYYFKKSIDLQPKSEWSLYGLGVAEERNGFKAKGARSIQAALAINPHVADLYKSVGLKP